MAMNNLFNLISERDLNPRKVALDLNISEGTLSEWKSGKRLPNVSTLIKVADYFGCSIDFLLDRSIPHGEEVRKENFNDND